MSRVLSAHLSRRPLHAGRTAGGPPAPALAAPSRGGDPPKVPSKPAERWDQPGWALLGPLFRAIVDCGQRGRAGAVAKAGCEVSGGGGPASSMHKRDPGCAESRGPPGTALHSPLDGSEARLWDVADSACWLLGSSADERSHRVQSPAPPAVTSRAPTAPGSPHPGRLHPLHPCAERGPLQVTIAAVQTLRCPWPPLSPTLSIECWCWGQQAKTFPSPLAARGPKVMKAITAKGFQESRPERADSAQKVPLALGPSPSSYLECRHEGRGLSSLLGP